MKISLQWLRDYVDLTPQQAAALPEVLPRLGLEVESVTTVGLAPNDRVVIGEVLSREQHPNADRLGVCQVNTGGETPLQIVCGATNYRVGDRVPVALVGAVLPGDFQIKASKLRGVDSQGMMCSAKELGLGSDHVGLLILPPEAPIGAPLHQLYAAPDTVIELELTANRGDCLSHVGVAREVAAWFRLPLRQPPTGSEPSASDAVATTSDVPVPPSDAPAISIHLDSSDCPYYAAWELSGVRVASSPAWLRQRLETIGLRSVNNVVDVTNFVLWEQGQPLHAFDADRLSGGRLHVRTTQAGERITTLDGKERCLPPGTLVVADDLAPQAIAGVMGAATSEVSETTHRILLESAWFSPAKVREASRGLNLFTDASHRFTRNVDPAGVLRAGERAVQLLQSIAGGHLTAGPTVLGTPPRGDRTIRLAPSFVSQKCGFNVGATELTDIFTRLGFSVAAQPGGPGESPGSDRGLPTPEPLLAVTVPSFRPEVDRPIDLVEEFIRLRGTDDLPKTPLRLAALHRDHAPLHQFNQNAQDYLTSLGALDCVHYTLVSRREVEAVAGPEAAEALLLDNPLTSELDALRASLLPGLLGALQRNAAHGHPQEKLAEVGRVFTVRDGQIWERAAVAVVLTSSELRQWRERPQPDFFTAKAIAEHLAQLAGLANPQPDPTQAPVVGPWSGSDLGRLWQQGHSATCSDALAGLPGGASRWNLTAGLISPSYAQQYDCRGLVWAVELTFEPELLTRPAVPSRFRAFQNHPATERDLALLVPLEQAAETVRQALIRAAETAVEKNFLLDGVSLFDVFRDETLNAQGHQSLAFSIRFRAADRTLTDKEVNAAFERTQSLIREAGYAIR